MSIRLSCTKCGTHLKVPDTAAGKRVKCSSCQEILRVPADATPAGVAAVPAPRPVPQAATARTAAVAELPPDVQLPPELQHNPLFDVARDQGPFIPIAREFKVNSARWIGRVIASEQAIYMLKVAHNTSNAGSAGLIGGLAGAMISSAMAVDDNVMTCTARDLPQAVYDQLDPKHRHPNCPVVIVPRLTVKRVNASWNNLITVAAGPDKFALVTSFFRIFKTPRQLAELGWTLNQDLTPVAGPVHDSRPPEERQPAQRLPLWARVALIVGAFVLVIMVLVLRDMMRGRH